MLKYTLVFALLVSVALSIFSEWHNPSHVLQTDQHCALCLGSHNLDHSLPLNLPIVSVVPVANAPLEVSVHDYQPPFVRVSGNRDPPVSL